MQEVVRNRYVYQKALLEEVVYNILYSASDKPLNERINFKMLDQDLKAEMMNNGINIISLFTRKMGVKFTDVLTILTMEKVIAIHKFFFETTLQIEWV